MRFRFLSSLFLAPCVAFSQIPMVVMHTDKAPKNSIVWTYSNETDHLDAINTLQRTMDYPTQVLRISSNMEGMHLTCDQVGQEINHKIFSQLTSDKFMYTAYVWCSPNPETGLAVAFLINSYIDPISDSAINYLNDYLEKNNGSDFLGSKLQFESAKELVVTIHLSAGMRMKPGIPPSTEYKTEHTSLYFKSNFDMRRTLIEDIFQNFYSNEPEKLLPFLKRWINAYADKSYKMILVDSNYFDLQPERVFLMESGEPIYLPMIKFYYNHDCNNHFENHRCLKLG